MNVYEEEVKWIKAAESSTVKVTGKCSFNRKPWSTVQFMMFIFLDIAEQEIGRKKETQEHFSWYLLCLHTDHVDS